MKPSVAAGYRRRVHRHNFRARKGNGLNTRESALSNAVITEAVALIEHAGPLDDAAAMREAFAQQQSPQGRITRRAQLLGERIGLQAVLSKCRAWAPWIGLGLALLIVIAGLGLAGSVVGERQINVMVALVSLLGFHLLTLLLWLLGLVLPLASFNASLGWLWLALTARMAGGKQGQAPVLLHAATRLLTRARLLPWAFGFVSHSIWSLSFIVVLASLLFALAFRNYTLTWETTILEPGFFLRTVQLLGIAPGWLGFPVPDAATVLAPASGVVNAAGQRDWALWLTGCIVVYGLLPRLLFVLLSGTVWKRRKAALQPDFEQPEFRKLVARFDAMEPTVILDADPGSAHTAAPPGLAPSEATDALAVVGFELPQEVRWPPVDLPADAAPVLQVDGSARQRRELLDTVARLRPRRLLMACHATSSPDRGLERLLRELLSHCGECRLWLVGNAAANPIQPDGNARQAPAQRWHDWLAHVGLDRIAASDDLVAALNGWKPA